MKNHNNLLKNKRPTGSLKISSKLLSLALPFEWCGAAVRRLSQLTFDFIETGGDYNLRLRHMQINIIFP
jgi:hypothetical protein